VRLVAAAATDVGQVREGNEDSFLHDERLGLFAVADGMGGHQAGEVASATAVEALRAAIAGGALVTDAVALANTAVVEKADANPSMQGMGTTMTAAIEVDGGLRIGHVGDSRCYVLRDGILARVTDDHSLVEELVREGRITLEQAAVHPQRSVITRALGIEAEVEVDDVALELTGGDRVLICSDGLSGMVRDADISAVLRRTDDPEAAAAALIDAANTAGGEDNITVVVIDVIGEPGDPPPSPLPEIGVGATAVRARAARAAASPSASPAVGDATTGAAPRRTGRTLRRALWFALPVVLVLGLAIAGVGWFARRQYYVGFRGERIAVYQGVPGGVFIWKPTVAWTSRTLERGDLNPAERLRVRDHRSYASEAEARAAVQRIQDRVTADYTQAATTTTTVPDALGASGASGATGPTN
jgi:protein phosphatase